MEKKVPILFIILLIAVLFFSSVEAVPEIPTQELQYDDHGGVFIDDENVYIRAPAEIHGSGWTYLNFTAKQYSGNIDFTIGFDTTHLKPKKAQLFRPHYENWTTQHKHTFYNVTLLGTYDGDNLDYGNSYNTNYSDIIEHEIPTYDENLTINGTVRVISNISYDLRNISNYPYNVTIYYHTQHSRHENYLDITHKFGVLPESIHNNYDGKNKWYYVTDQPVTAGIEYQIRIWVDAPPQIGPHFYKYDVVVKPSIHTFQEAINDGTLYVLDPYWNTTWSAYSIVTMNATVPENDFQIHLTNATFTIPLAMWNEMNHDGNDTRILNYNHTIEFPFWIEHLTARDNYSIWANVTDNTSATYQWYYGNPSASSTSDGTATWRLFEDFTGTSQIFTLVGAHVSHDTTNNVLNVTGMRVDEDCYAYYDLGANAIGEFQMHYKAKITKGSNQHERVDVGVGNEIDDAYNNDLFLGSDTIPGDVYKESRSQEYKTTSGQSGNPTTIVSGTIYYNSLYREGNNLVLHTYTDPARTNELGTSPSTLATADSDLLRYVFAANSLNYAAVYALGSSYITDIRFGKYVVNTPIVTDISEPHFYVDSLHYNATTPYNHTVIDVLTVNHTVYDDDINHTASSTGTSYLLVNSWDNSSSTPLNFTVWGANLDWLNVTNLTSGTTYNLKSNNGTTIQSIVAAGNGTANFTADMAAKTWTISSAVGTYKNVGGVYYFWDYTNIPELYAGISNNSVLSYNATEDIYTFHDQFLQNDTTHTFYYNETVHFESLNDGNEANFKWMGEVIFDNATTIGWNTGTNTTAPITDNTRAYMTSQVVGHGNITNSNFSNLGYNAALSRGLDLVTHTNMTFHNNTFTSNFYAVVFTTFTNGTITNNTAHDCKYGLVIDDARNSSISNNTMYSNDFDGIYMTDNFNNTIDNNTIRNNDQDGFMVYDSENNTFKNNTVYSNGWEGFHLYNASNNTLSNNNVSDAGGVYYDYKIWTGSINTIIIDTVKTSDYYYIDTSSHFLTFNNGVDYNITVTETTVIQDNATVDVEAVNISVISGTIGQIGVTSLTATTAYQLQYQDGTHVEIITTNGAGTATFDSNLGVGDYNIVSPFAPIVTLLSQSPSELYQNSTGYVNISYGISHDTSGLNNTSIAFIYRNYDPDCACSNHSIRPPNNSVATTWDVDGRILRGANRNETLNFEANATITGGDIFSWSGLDYDSARLTVLEINDTYTKVYINGTIHDIMPQMWYLDRSELQAASKTSIPIHKTQNLLIKFWELEIFKGNYDFLGVGYTDTYLNPNPALRPSDANPVSYYYVSDGYDPVTGGDPITSGYAVYMGSKNASGWIDYVYEPHINSSYTRGFINNTLLHTYVNTTNISYVYFTSNTPSSKPFYMNMTDVASSTNIGFNETNVAWAGDNTLSQIAYTPNIWFSFMKDNITFDHKLYVADTVNKWGNSTLSSTVVGKALFPPTRPDINHIHLNGDTDYDMNGTYSGTIRIGVGVSSDPDGGDVLHNLTLHYGANNTYVTTINNTFTDCDLSHGIYADINFNTTPYYSTHNYTLRVIATDNEGESVTAWLGVNFTLNDIYFTFSNEALTPSVIPQYAYFTYSVDINDTLGSITSAKISFNSINYTMAQGSGDTWSVSVQGAIPTIYRIDVVWATDNHGGTNSTTSALTCDVLRAGGHGGGGGVPIVPTPTPTPTITPVPTEIPEIPVNVTNISDIINRLISKDAFPIFRMNFNPAIHTYEEKLFYKNPTKCEETSDWITECSVENQEVTVVFRFFPDTSDFLYFDKEYITVYESHDNFTSSRHETIKIFVMNFMATVDLPKSNVKNPSIFLFSSDELCNIKGLRMWWPILMIMFTLIIIGIFYRRTRK